MPYGVDENLWKRLPPGDQASIKRSWRAARASPPAPTRAATPTPTRPGTATSHPVQPKAAPASRPAAQARKAATPVTPAYLHALTRAADITSAQIPSIVAAAQQKGLASPAAIVEARHTSQFTAPPLVQPDRSHVAPHSPGSAFIPTPVAGSSTSATGQRIPASVETAAETLPPRIRNEKPPHPWISPSHPLGPHYADARLRALGATPDEIWIIDHESGGYTHAWNFSRTPSGYAYGLGQVTGLFRLQHFGAKWQSDDPRIQIKMMQAYIRYGSQHFHTDAGALAFWKANGWY